MMTASLQVMPEQLAALVDLFDRNAIGESFSTEGDPLLRLSHDARVLHRAIVDEQARADAAGAEPGLAPPSSTDPDIALARERKDPSGGDNG